MVRLPDYLSNPLIDISNSLINILLFSRKCFRAGGGLNYILILNLTASISTQIPDIKMDKAKVPCENHSQNGAPSYLSKETDVM